MVEALRTHAPTLDARRPIFRDVSGTTFDSPVGYKNPPLSIDLQALAATQRRFRSGRRPKAYDFFAIETGTLEPTLSSIFRSDLLLNKPLIHRNNLVTCSPHHHELVNGRSSLQSM